VISSFLSPKKPVVAEMAKSLKLMRLSRNFVEYEAGDWKQGR
jgi:hypothetical protein